MATGNGHGVVEGYQKGGVAKKIYNKIYLDPPKGVYWWFLCT